MAKTQLDYLARWKYEDFRASGRSVYTTAKYLSLYIALAIFLLAAASLPWLYTLKLDRDLAQANQNVAGLNQIQQRVNQLDALNKQVDDGNKVIVTYNQYKLDPNKVLSKIMPLLPRGTTVSTLAIQEDLSFQINLNIPTPVDVSRLWISFEDSGLFQLIDIKTVSLQDKPQSLNLTLKFIDIK